MGMFDAIRYRKQRKKARRTYRKSLEKLDIGATSAEVEVTKRRAAKEAGKHLISKHRSKQDARLRDRLDRQARDQYKEALSALSAEAIVDGSWHEEVQRVRSGASPWLKDSSRTSVEQTFAHRTARQIIAEGHVDDHDLDVLGDFLIEFGAGGMLVRDGVYHEIVGQRLRQGLPPRSRHDPALVLEPGERALLVEDVQFDTYTQEGDEHGDTQVHPTQATARLELTDQRLALFADGGFLEAPLTDIVACKIDQDHGRSIATVHLRSQDIPVGFSGPIVTFLPDALQLVRRED